MPPATKKITAGAGLTAGLELHTRADGKFILHDSTTDSRFAEDVALWSAGLNPPTRKKTKNAPPA
jgi:hypothetical protein